MFIRLRVFRKLSNSKFPLSYLDEYQKMITSEDKFEIYARYTSIKTNKLITTVIYFG